MEIVSSVLEGATVVSIVGTVDSGTASDLAAALRERVSAPPAHVVADLSGVDYMSSAGLRALLENVKEARQRNGDLRLSGVRPNVLRVLDLSGFTKILKVFPDAASAAASFAA